MQLNFSAAERDCGMSPRGAKSRSCPTSHGNEKTELIYIHDMILKHLKITFIFNTPRQARMIKSS